MPCFHPVLAYRGKHKSANGKYPIVFNCRDGFSDLTVTIPCGWCLGCRLEKARQWKVRIMHEASLNESNCFLTLTYRPEDLPAGGSLVKRDLQLFFKRLRKRLDVPIKYYAVGEYGEALSRPHYHVCVFGFDFPDKVLWQYDKRPDRSLFRSALLEDVWSFGFSSVGTLTPDSASYVARYVQKKITGERAVSHYSGKVPEFALMSRGGRNGHGLAYDWFKQYSTDVYPKDFVTMKGKKERPPRYYDALYEVTDAERMIKIKAARAAHAKDNPESLRRLFERERYKKLVVKHSLRRHFEDGTDNLKGEG